VVVNCAALPETLLESELFGHEAGAFTDAKLRRIGRFEQATGGTIFLDEIGDMSLSTQVKLLRVVQERTIQRLGGKETIAVDVRILAATHRDLEAGIREGTFRSDLYFRITEAVIRLPALRERRSDIADLAAYFIQRDGHDLGGPVPALTNEAIVELERQSWPGNIRELRNVIRRVLLLARGYPVTCDHICQALSPLHRPMASSQRSLARYIRALLTKAARGELLNAASQLRQSLERELYIQAITLSGGDQSQAARWLGVSRPTIREKLAKYAPREKAPTLPDQLPVPNS
jgi:DNA-binding NtrC family response regulator